MVPAVKRHIDAEKQKVNRPPYRFVAFLYDVLSSNTSYGDAGPRPFESKEQSLVFLWLNKGADV